MARIAGVNIPQNKLVRIGLTYIYGIGEKFSNDICKSLEIPSSKRVNELTDEEILKIRELIDEKFTSVICRSCDFRKIKKQDYQMSSMQRSNS